MPGFSALFPNASVYAVLDGYILMLESTLSELLQVTGAGREKTNGNVNYFSLCPIFFPLASNIK